MKKSKMAIKNPREGKIAELAKKMDHKTLAKWGLDCAERVLHYFEDKYPKDGRPRVAIETGRAWVRTGVFRMAVIRKASLDSHAAAREVKDDEVARSAARAAGQAVAAAHVPEHALAAAAYAATVMRDAASPADADAAVEKEREWQYRHLLELREHTKASSL
jgi:glutamate synthase domain-containing protein 2